MQELALQPVPDIAIFVSTNAVDYGLAAIRDSGALIGAVGPATRAAIEAAGVRVAISVGSGSNTETLLTHPALQDIRDLIVTIVRGETGRELLADTLMARGAKVSYLSTYRREMRCAAKEEVNLLDQRLCRGDIDCVTVMSVETLQNLLHQLPLTSLEVLQRTPLVAPGARVIQTAMELVPGVPAMMAAGPQTADIISALIETRHSGRN